jgi:predicted TIM-barrel fold metal-dependent hydrolase
MGALNAANGRNYLLVDADSHVNEPPDLWTTRVSSAYRDRAPRIESLEEGDAWILEGVADPINFGLNATAGMDPDRMKAWVRFEDIRRGGYDPAARLAEMDRDRVDAAVLYPTPRLSQSVIANPDPGFHLELVRAYNDWLSEYCEKDPSRLSGMAIIPNRGIDQALAEIDRMGDRPGIGGMLLGCYPHGDTEIAEEDDAVWQAIVDRDMAVHIHVAMGNSMPAAHKSKIVGDVRFYDAPKRILQFVWSGVFDRVPGLRVVVAEVDCGWVPYFTEQVDDRYYRLGQGANVSLSAPPSHYIHEHFYFTYITDHYGLRNRESIGVDKILWSSDYPHVGADWPNSWRTIAADFSGIPDDERSKILAGNALGLYRFDAR